MSIMRELVDISDDLMKPNSSLELHGRLITAATFALNFIFTLGKETCWGIHVIGHQLTAEYGIDHGATLAMVAPRLLRKLISTRGYLMARSAERVFDIHEGSDEEKAKKFIDLLQQWSIKLGHVLTVHEWEGASEVKPGDVDKATKMVMDTTGGKPFGWNHEITEAITRDVLKEIIV